MEKRRETSYREVEQRVERLRRLYSEIREPLPADVIIDLYLHLGMALGGLQENKAQSRSKH